MSEHETAARGINQLEGYLLLQAENTNAVREAEEFARLMPWLTGARREEVVALYAERRMAVSRTAIRTVADRCRELRQEYTERYEELRRRLLCATAATVLGVLVLCVLVELWIRSALP
ncbi:hypothetical protein GCM10010406_07620 [Streptomyces thermolineatus]|uniref:Uncharacterized protein n=1 Tax=Streptomyces thermolineatus TaxID=44033 RepID=A0ABP5Y2V9_9ACTN